MNAEEIQAARKELAGMFGDGHIGSVFTARMSRALSALEACQREREELRAAVKRAEDDAGREIAERDESNDALAVAALILGCPHEWSNLHSHAVCVPILVAALAAGAQEPGKAPPGGTA